MTRVYYRKYDEGIKAEQIGNLPAAMECYLGGLALLQGDENDHAPLFRARFETEAGRVYARQAFDMEDIQERNRLLGCARQKLEGAANALYNITESVARPHKNTASQKLLVDDLYTAGHTGKTSLTKQAIRAFTLLANLYILQIFDERTRGMQSTEPDLFGHAANWYDRAFTLADISGDAALTIRTITNGMRGAYLAGNDANFEAWNSKHDEVEAFFNGDDFKAASDDIGRMSEIMESTDHALGSLLVDFELGGIEQLQ